MGPEIWQNNEGDVDPEGLGWIPRVRGVWQGEVFAMGTFVKITKDPHPQAVTSTPSLPLRTLGPPQSMRYNNRMLMFQSQACI